jgi:hypothetical protein
MAHRDFFAENFTMILVDHESTAPASRKKSYLFT